MGIGPRGVDTHGATQKAAFAGLEFVIGWFVNHDRFRCCRLIRVPSLDGAVDAGSTSRHADGIGFQCFGKIMRSALSTSWTQLFSLMGNRPIISEPAAIRIASTAAVVGSIASQDSFQSLAVVDKRAKARNSFYRYILKSHCWVWTIGLRMANT